MKVLFGPCRGLSWIKGSGPDSIWLGFNEARKRRQFARSIRSGQVVYDVGAHVGSYTLLAARRVGPSGRVVAIEPLPDNLAFLEAHVRINGLSNVTIEPAALWRESSVVAFRGTPDRVTSSISEDGSIRVRTTTLDAIHENGKVPPPDCIKIDVEGAESAVLEGGRKTLREHRPLVFVATHSDEQDRACREILGHAGYEVSTIGKHVDELVAVPRQRATDQA